MSDPISLSKSQVLALLLAREKELAAREEELTAREEELAAERKEIAKRNDIIEQLEAQIKQLELDYLKLWQERFAAKSERYIKDPRQLQLDFGDTDEAADAAEGLADAVDEAGLAESPVVPNERKKRKKRDESLPVHLPRRVTVVPPAPQDLHCPLHGEKQLLPESMSDVVERLVHVPAQLYVDVLVYQKYACACSPECGIASAERPTGIVEGDKYDASIAAEIITNKYAYHLPVYRQQDLFAGSGWTPSRSTMLNILTRCHFILAPLLAYFKRVLQSDSHMACDDTGITLLYPKVLPEFDLSDPKEKRIAEVYAEAKAANKPSINAKMWAYRGVNVKLNLFDFTVSRHRDGPELFFQNFVGSLLGDCWHGFEAIALASDNTILRGACNAHARRKFDEATDYPQDREKWLDWYQLLYDIEARASLVPDEERLRMRQEEAKPIWDTMRAELDGIDERTQQVVLPKSNLRKALNYLRNHWIELTRHLDDPKLPMDNNECEQLMRQVALGRKNWLFVGSVAGGERNAAFLTFASSAHRNDLDVHAYIRDILQRLLDGETDYEPMLPWNWAATHPESVRVFRQEERRVRDTRKQTERAKRRVRSRLLEQRDNAS